MLRARAGNSRRIAFLKGVVADQMGRHLPREADNRDRIHQGIGEPGHGIRRAGARRDQDDADLSGRAGIAFGRVHRALLMTDQNMADMVLLENLVVNRENGAAGIAEYDLDALIDQGLDDHACTGQFAIPRHGTCSLLAPQTRVPVCGRTIAES